MGLHDSDTVRVAPPARRVPSALLSAAVAIVVLGCIAGVVAIVTSPGLRQRLLAVHAPLVSVAIESTPSGAQAFIDDEPAGTTPLEARVAPGRHSVRLVHPDCEPWRGDIETASTHTLKATLRPLELATLIVESVPGGADVFVDGGHHGATPVHLDGIEPDTYTVRIADEPIYQAVTHRVELKPRETRRLSVRLDSKLESLYRGRIRKQPAKLTSYIELLHHYLEVDRNQQAVVLATQTVKMIGRAEATAIEHAQFQTQLEAVCRWRARWVSQAAREALFAALLARFRALATAAPSAPANYLPIATLLEKSGRFDTLLAACDNLAKTVPAAALLHVHIAQAYLGQGELAAATSLLQHAVQLQPNSFQAHGLLGLAYHRAERLDDALAQYQAADKLAASAPPALRTPFHTHVARLYADRGDMAAAVARFDKALGLDAPAAQATKLTDGLVLHYPFDKDAADASGKNHHGQAHGAKLVAGGRLGGAFAFDGAKDYVAIPVAATQGLATWTLALWVKTTQTSTASRSSYWSQPTLVGVASAGYGSGDLGLALRGGNVAYFHGLTPNGADMIWASAVSAADGKWHHIAMVNAGPMVLVYIDGKLARGKASTTGAGTATLGLVPDTSAGAPIGQAGLLVGACNAAFGRMRPACFYRGLIDDLRLWNRPLRSTHIAALATGK